MGVDVDRDLTLFQYFVIKCPIVWFHKLLIMRYGANVDTINKNGKSALITAIDIRNFDLVQLFFKSSANGLETEVNGKSLLEYSDRIDRSIYFYLESIDKLSAHEDNYFNYNFLSEKSAEESDTESPSYEQTNDNKTPLTQTNTYPIFPLSKHPNSLYNENNKISHLITKQSVFALPLYFEIEFKEFSENKHKQLEPKP